MATKKDIEDFLDKLGKDYQDGKFYHKCNMDAKDYKQPDWQNATMNTDTLNKMEDYFKKDFKINK